MVYMNGGSVVKTHLSMQKTQVRSLGQEDPPEKEMAIQHSCLGNPVDRGYWRATVHRVTKDSNVIR